ncbi:hypothetical protein FOL46_005890, partial [Perkinsus olseni]
MTWEEQASYLAYHDRCDLGTTASVKIMIRPRSYVITNCHHKGFNSFRTISYVPKDLNIPGPHNKEWCIRYFRAVGFLPGKSLDWARKTMCDANYFRSGKWKQQDEEQTRKTVANGGSEESSKEKPVVKWEDQASYYAYHDRCDLGTTETVKIMIRPRNYVMTNCDRKGFNSFRTINYVPKDVNIPGPHNKEWCIRYFRAVGFLPGESLDWARKTMCDADYFRSEKWKEQGEDRSGESVVNGGSDESSEGKVLSRMCLYEDNLEKPVVKWEDQASYYAYHDRCDLGTTETVKIMIRPRNYVITNCDRKGFNSFRTINYVPNDVNIPGPHNKEWCIRYFRAVGFLPGESLDWARKTMCDADYFRSEKWKEQEEDRSGESAVNGGSDESSE